MFLPTSHPSREIDAIVPFVRMKTEAQAGSWTAELLVSSQVSEMKYHTKPYSTD